MPDYDDRNGKKFYHAAHWFLLGEDPMTEERRKETDSVAGATRDRSLDELLIGISTRMINLPVEEADAAILEGLGEISRFVGADRAHVVSVSPDKTHCSMSHEWCAPGIETKRELFQNVPVERFPWTGGKIFRGEVVVLSGPGDYPPHAAEELAAARALGGQSFVLAPMQLRGAVVGLVGFVAVTPGRLWDKHAISVLKLVGNTFANAIEHQRESRELSEHQTRERVLTESLLNASLDPALLIDGEGRVLMVNTVVAERLGKSPRDMIGATLYDLFPREVADARLEIVRQAIKTGLPVRYQDGHFGRHFDSLVSPVREPDGRIESVAVYSRDVTFHHQMDQEILNVSTRERQRFGHDLHDRLGQQLTGIRFLVAALAGKAREKDESLAEDAARIDGLVTDAIDHVRRISRGLAPVGLEDGDLEVALGQLAADTEELFRVKCVTRLVEAESKVNGTVATELYWIASEAVSNAVKYGSPSEIDVMLQIRGQRGLLSVHDNGSGLPEKWEGRGGMGIRIMRYRASVIGAKIEIESGNGEGTTVACLFSTHLNAGQAMPGGNPMPLR